MASALAGSIVDLRLGSEYQPNAATCVWGDRSPMIETLRLATAEAIEAHVATDEAGGTLLDELAIFRAVTLSDVPLPIFRKPAFAHFPCKRGFYTV